MIQPVFQSLLVDHIWIATIVSENVLRRSSIDAIIFNCKPLIWSLCCFIGLFQLVQDSAYNQTFKLSFVVVFFRMVHNEKIFRRSRDKYRTFSEDPTWSDIFLCSYKKWKAAINCSQNVAYTVKIVKFLVNIISEHPWKAIFLVIETETVWPCLA